MGKGRKWSEEDIEYLKDKWGSLPAEKIAKKLKRPVTALFQKAYRLGLENYVVASEYIFLKELVETLGYSPCTRTYNKWINAGLEIKYVDVKSKSFKMVSIPDFWRWLFANQSVISLHKMERNSLGLEPAWVDDKRKRDESEHITLNKLRKEWTKREENLLLSKAKSNRYTIQELAKDFSRTESGIRRKLFEYGILVQKKQRFNNDKYTKEEEEKVIRMYNDGYSNYSIALELRRSEFGVRDKIRRMKVQEKIA